MAVFGWSLIALIKDFLEVQQYYFVIAINIRAMDKIAFKTGFDATALAEDWERINFLFLFKI